MKFSHSLQFNAVPEWSSRYIAYSQLKKLIYSLQKDKLYYDSSTATAASNSDLESTPLIHNNNNPADTSKFDPIKTFVTALDRELTKIDRFYTAQELLLIDQFDDLLQSFTEYINSEKIYNVHTTSSNGDNNSLIHGSNVNGEGQNDIPQRGRSSSSPPEIGQDDSNIERLLSEDDEDEYDAYDNGSLTSLNRRNSNTSNRKYGNTLGNSIIASVHDMLINPVISKINSSSTLNEYQQGYLEHKVTLKKKIISMFTQLSELKSYIELNQTGFSKICKKFDKSLETNIKLKYLTKLPLESHIFDPNTLKKLDNLINQTIVMYAKLLSGDLNNSEDPYKNDSSINFQEAENELSLHLREHVVWERNTVWKDMMNLERKSQNIKVAKKKSFNRNKKKITKKKSELNQSNNSRKSSNSIPSDYASTDGRVTENQVEQELGQLAEMDNNSLSLANSDEENSAIDNIVTFRDLFKISPWKFIKFFILYNTPLLKFIFISSIATIFYFKSPFSDIQQKNCLVILVFASLLWATETIPLFITALLVPLLIVVMPVLKNASTNEPLNPIQSSQYILSTMWSSVIMLLLGGFTLAAALSKYNIAKVLSTHILSRAGTNPKIILLTNMLVALFVSMWVSNVAAPVLCYSIIQPLLRTLPKHSSFAKSLILGIALASNVGGMASPIASPQNIISIGIMSPTPSWATWFIVALPVCAFSIAGIWLLLLLTFPIDANLKILKFHPIRDPFTLKQWYVVLVTIVTIILWCLANALTEVFGEMGIISILPMALLFGTGLLSSDDFNNFMWTIVILAMGGTTLGKAVSSSGLLSSIAETLKASVETKPVFTIVLLFGLVVVTMATFVSHTVAAMIILPLMKELGEKLPSGNHSNLLIMVSTLLCSGAMALPTSGFPNVTAISMIDDFGERYLTVGNFITRGVPATLWSYLMIVIVGYGLMRFVGY
ncbi:related to Low-affinity phosphate transporter PHO91 [Saccharomycodes ludwigii]|uniref:Related to Low-affinity phosphate transporter PHO91 n=1 Tax=Saccharomycodes ludwigii TaxID=36035 RepID=A0A376B6Q8_9ASCO|nr:related to Low-affinity phosphate transporter PHO91 [Saccharomycodes ludwigii]